MMRRMKKRAAKIIVLAAVLLTAVIPAIVITSNQNTATNMYLSLLLYPNNSHSGYSNIQTRTKAVSTGFEYYVPFVENSDHGNPPLSSNLFIYSPVNTIIRIDSDNDDVFETVLSITANNLTIYSTPTAGTHILCNDPVLIYYKYLSNNGGVYDDQSFAYTLLPVESLGTDYYLPSNPKIISIVATQDNTNIQVDTNNDGTPEATYNNLDRGIVRTYSNPPAGTHVTSNNPIFVVTVNYDWVNEDSTYGYSLIPTDRLGTEYWFNIDYKSLRINVINDYTALHIVATQNETQLYVDSTNYDLNAGESVIHTFNKGSISITSDKPVG
ncbi:MAG: hypothetical protein ACETWM_01075, partial [Candidatus Lokiarchaeia archaeon]